MNDQPQPPASPAPGWYPDPDGSPRQRYWDGNAWTQSYQDAGPGGVPPKKRSGWLTALAVVGGLIGLLIVVVIIAAIAGGGGDDDDDDGGSQTESPSETEEVTVTSCENGVLDLFVIKGTAENTSSDRLDYFIDLAIEGADGTQLGTTTALAENVEPDQTAQWEAQSGTDFVEGATCSVVRIQRLPSL